MLAIDSITPLTLSIDDLNQLPNSQVNGFEKFKLFHQGITLTPDALLSERWSNIDSTFSNSLIQTVHFVVMEMLPNFYDVKQLESLGGVFGITISGVGNYTIYDLNQRVVVLSGLPVDMSSHEKISHVTLNADIFIGYLRGLLLDFSQDILLDDDEDEDRIISDTELQLYGMPAGGGGGSSSNSCYADAAACASDQITSTACVVDGEACSQNIQNGSACAADTGACGADATSGVACGTDVIACGANTEAGSTCVADSMFCGANAGGGSIESATVSVCGANASAVNASIANAEVCGGNVSAAVACAGNADACLTALDVADACAGKASACVVDAAAGVCAGNADACVVKALDFCGAHAGACVIDVEDGDIVSACIINVIPGLPSC